MLDSMDYTEHSDGCQCQDCLQSREAEYLADTDGPWGKSVPIKKHCYQCDQEVDYLFSDGRGYCCTRETPPF